MNTTERYFNVLKDNYFNDLELQDLEPLDQISLLLDLEREFKISINDDKAADLFIKGTHEEFIKYIEELI